ncbi:hypothetical protein DB29_00536 [Shouchella clausii]|nr:hypothetical protein DB29_00536 [Shouchella clausii]
MYDLVRKSADPAANSSSFSAFLVHYHYQQKNETGGGGDGKQ